MRVSATILHDLTCVKPGGAQPLGKTEWSDYMNAKVTVINPDGTEIQNFDANLVHEGDIMFTMGGTFKSIPALEAEHSLKEVGNHVSEKLCVIRKIVTEHEVKKQPARRMEKKEFLSELNGLHR